MSIHYNIDVHGYSYQAEGATGRQTFDSFSPDVIPHMMDETGWKDFVRPFPARRHHGALVRKSDGKFLPAGIGRLVERSFAWLGRYRRLAIVFERSREYFIATLTEIIESRPMV
jgi:hypothetical protein